MKNKIAIFIVSISCLLFSLPSLAAVTLLDQNEWKVLMSGFVETDLINDSVRSYNEVIGNTPVDPSGTLAGDNGRTQFSIRNSRLAFTILSPMINDWKSTLYFEMDFMGYDPSPSSSAPTNSEGSFSTNPSLRLRHGYWKMEKNNWTILSGQTWTLFGWQPAYTLTTASVSPAPGMTYERTQEIIGMQKIGLSDSESLQWGVAVARPAQRDSQIPNVDVGLRVASTRRTSGYAAASGNISAEPMSLAVTATRREFTTPDSATATSGQTHYTGQAMAMDLLLPLITNDDGSASGTLTFTGEATAGSGYGDQFSGWSGNLAQLPSGAGIPSVTNLDAGQGGFDAAGNFHLIKLQSVSMQLQYHFPTDWHSFMTVGYGTLHSSNVGDLTPVSGTKTIYDRTGIGYVNLFHDCTPQLRFGLEYSEVKTHYVDGVQPVDHRYQISSYFRF